MRSARGRFRLSANMKPLFTQHRLTKSSIGRRICRLILLGLAFAGSVCAKYSTKREKAVAKYIAAGRVSRYTRPWPSLHRRNIDFPSLTQSRHRVLFSSLRRLGGDGLGHGFATKNAEVYTAYLLGLTYTHRQPVFNTITQSNENLMEEFFGWGIDELGRDSFQADNCNNPLPNTTAKCATCSKPKGKYNVVYVPHAISFTNPTPSLEAQTRVKRFLAQHNNSYTIFHMDPSVCDSYPFYSTFDRTGEWFRYKFWKHHYAPHGSIKTQAQQLYGRAEPETLETTSLPSGDVRDAPIKFDDKELTIAVHVRRGDFFTDKKRVSLRSSVYAQIIRTVQDVVQEAGGPFARQPVAVYIYSEGRPKQNHINTNKPRYRGHDVSSMTKDYVDENGIVRTQQWWLQLIEGIRPQVRNTSDSLTYLQISPTPRVELRVSQSTVQTLHQMIRADIFIGSVSGLSTYLVKNLARGVGVYPATYLKDHSCCVVNSNIHNGYFNRQRFLDHWNAYRRENEHYLESGNVKSA